jgi:hypothetical protein
MSEKTMGQVAFEAYRAQVKTAFNGDLIPEWEALDNGAPARAGWEAAALAVLAAQHDLNITLAGVDPDAYRQAARQIPSRWQPLKEFLPEGVKYPPLPPIGAGVLDEYRVSVPLPVEAGPDDDR